MHAGPDESPGWHNHTVKGSEKKMEHDTFMGLLTIFAVIGIVFVFVGPVSIIEAGHAGVLLNFGKVIGVFDAGLNFKMPLIQSVVVMDLRTQKYEVQMAAATKDLMDVKTSVAVNYKIQRDAVDKLFLTVGVNYEENVIAPAVLETSKGVTAKYNAQELITERQKVKNDMEVQLQERLNERGIFVESLSITNLEFPATFNEAITAQQTAGQKKLQAETELLTAKIEAEKAVAKAKGDADALKVVKEQLENSPEMLQYRAIEKWDGVLPLATGGATPFIDISAK